MTKVYIALGSNLDNPLSQLQQAVHFLQKSSLVRQLKVSPFYGSKPRGPQDQPDYVNAVASFDTDLEPLALLDWLQAIEHQQGRVRVRRWGERTLDLDILLYGEQVINHERLIVPHYDMQHREFVIVPLYDLAPELCLPSGQKLAEMYSQFANHQMAILS